MGLVGSEMCIRDRIEAQCLSFPPLSCVRVVGPTLPLLCSFRSRPRWTRNQPHSYYYCCCCAFFALSSSSFFCDHHRSHRQKPSSSYVVPVGGDVVRESEENGQSTRQRLVSPRWRYTRRNDDDCSTTAWFKRKRALNSFSSLSCKKEFEFPARVRFVYVFYM